MQTALYPGTFDPITHGHLDVIERGARLVDKFVIGVAASSGKTTAFSLDERLEMVRGLVKDMKNVEVESLEGMTVDLARKHGAKVIIRGIRTLTDFDYEFQLALANRKLDDSVETVFILAGPEHSDISSTLIKEAAALGGDLSRFVPKIVAEALANKLGKKE